MMDLQLIFVVETDSKSKSDWIYIKDTVDYFYNYDQSHVKFSPVYMDGKGNYTKVIYCFDCDDFDTNRVEMDFLKNAKEYCDEKQYEFVWFCKDIERVYIGKKVPKREKTKEAAKFKSRKIIQQTDERKLTVSNYIANTSNILKVIDKYLERK